MTKKHARTHATAQQYWLRERRKRLTEPNGLAFAGGAFCHESFSFVKANTSLKHAWNTCRRPEWMIYWLTLMGVGLDTQAAHMGVRQVFLSEVFYNPSPGMIRKHFTVLGRKRKVVTA